MLLGGGAAGMSSCLSCTVISFVSIFLLCLFLTRLVTAVLVCLCQGLKSMIIMNGWENREWESVGDRLG